MSEPSWSDLQRPSPKSSAADNEFDALCARMFITADGKELLASLRRKHFEHGGNPLADERALRVRAAQQQFVRDIEIARDRGLAAAVKQTKDAK